MKQIWIKNKLEKEIVGQSMDGATGAFSSDMPLFALKCSWLANISLLELPGNTLLIVNFFLSVWRPSHFSNITTNDIKIKTLRLSLIFISTVTY